jgi:WYL domain
VILRVQGTADEVRARPPATIALVEDPPPGEGGGSAQGAGWARAGIRAERLDWLPPLLASLGLPFVIEQPDELRALVMALADRLAAAATAPAPGDDCAKSEVSSSPTGGPSSCRR